VTAYDDLWSGTALKALSLLPVALQDQAEALVREICRSPRDPKYPPSVSNPRAQVGSAGPVTVVFEVSLVDNLVHITAVYRND